MTDTQNPPTRIKFSRRALQALRAAKTMSNGGTYALGGLERKRKPQPINLRLPKEER